MKNIILGFLLLLSAISYSQPILYDTVRVLGEINAINADAYPWISSDGLRIYYTHGAPTYGAPLTLMYTERPNITSTFSSPIPVPINISNPYSCWLTNDELTVYVCKQDSFFYADRSSTSSSFGVLNKIELVGAPFYTFHTSPYLNSTEDKLYISLFTTSTKFKIAEFTRSASSNVFVFDRIFPFSSAYKVRNGCLSKDELTYFVSAEYNNGNARLYQLTRAVTDTFDLSTIQEIQNINDPIKFNMQPSMSDNLDWVVFVKGNGSTWSQNDLYLAHKGMVSPVYNPQTVSFNLFPNPTAGAFTISLPTNQAQITITDFFGRRILQQHTKDKTTTLRLDHSGIYIINIESDLGVGSRKLIVTE